MWKNTVTRFLSYYLSFSLSTSQPILKVNRKHESTKNGDWQHYAATLHDSPTIFSIREYHSPMRVCSTMSLPDCRFRIGLRTPNTARSARLGFEPPITIRFHISQNFIYMLIVNFQETYQSMSLELFMLFKYPFRNLNTQTWIVYFDNSFLTTNLEFPHNLAKFDT